MPFSYWSDSLAGKKANSLQFLLLPTVHRGAPSGYFHASLDLEYVSRFQSMAHICMVRQRALTLNNLLIGYVPFMKGILQ